MKRLLAILAMLAMLLAGCGGKVPIVTTADNATPLPETTTTPPTTVPSELYDPSSGSEVQTGSALQVYPLDFTYCSGAVPMGDGLLLFYVDDNSTTLSLVTGEKLAPAARIKLDCFVFPDNPNVIVTESGVIYYDFANNAVVSLNESLQEVSRIHITEEFEETLALSPDGATIYYCLGTQIRALDLQSGISRLLREQPCQWQSITQLHCNGTVLQVYSYIAEGDGQYLYLSTETGELLSSNPSIYGLQTYEDRFYAQSVMGPVTEWIFGKAGSEVQVLEPADADADLFWLPKSNGAISSHMTQTGWEMTYYDLATGTLTAQISIDSTGAWSYFPDESGKYVWFLCYEPGTTDQLLCRWDLEKSAVSDEQTYTSRRYTAQRPNTAGLAQCQQEADRISAAYGVQILLWKDAAAAQPWDYSFEGEYLVRRIQQGLETLDQVMSQFPEGFFQTAAERSESGMIRIALLRGIYGDPEQGALTSADGLQYWMDTDPYIGLALGDKLEQNFYHELYHVIENRLLGKTLALDDWEKLNPEDFDYDYSYITNLDRTDTTYLEGENQAFIDFYSMSYPKEDRARIMEYAAMPDNSAYFQSSYMQKKLQQLCEGIREAFELEEYPEMLLWEQYLETSLIPE